MRHDRERREGNVMHTESREPKSRTKTWIAVSITATAATLVLSLVAAIVLFLLASEQARQASGFVEFPEHLFGILMFTGFRHGARFGVHASTGLLAFPVIILAVSFTTSVPALKAFLAATR